MAKRSAARNTKRTTRRESVEEMPMMDENVSERRSVRSSRGRSAALSRDEDRDYREILREFISSPAVKYIAGGIATALLTRLANNMADRYPEMATFIRENMDNLESKLGEFRGIDGDAASRH